MAAASSSAGGTFLSPHLLVQWLRIYVIVTSRTRLRLRRRTSALTFSGFWSFQFLRHWRLSLRLFVDGHFLQWPGCSAFHRLLYSSLLTRRSNKPLLLMRVGALGGFNVCCSRMAELFVTFQSPHQPLPLPLSPPLPFRPALPATSARFPAADSPPPRHAPPHRRCPPRPTV